MPPAIDPHLLDVQTFGDKALAHEILGMFREQMPTLLQALRASSGPARAEVAHRLKGSALAIGATALAEDAAALEVEPGAMGALNKVEHSASGVLADIDARLGR